MENCHTIKINNNNNNSLKDNNYTHINSINNNYKNILNSNNKKKIELSSESCYDQDYNNIEIIKRKKLSNDNNDNIIYISSNIIETDKENIPTYNSEIEQNFNKNRNIIQEKKNNNMSTLTENTEIITDNNKTEVNDTNIESSSALPTPPQTPKTTYVIPETESLNKPLKENDNDIEVENDKKDEILVEQEQEYDNNKPTVTFGHINVSVHDEINDIKPCILADTSSEEDDDENDDDSNDEYEDINISEEFNDSQIENFDDIESATDLLSASNINSNESTPMPNTTPAPVPSQATVPILINNNEFNNISFGSLVNQNNDTVSFTYNDSTLNSGDSTLIQQSSFSSYLDKEDEEMSESSIYLKKFNIYAASASQPKNPRPTGTLPAICKEDCGEDAYFILDQPSFSALGIADGVCGWTFLGYDPSLFAWDLMNCCKECATTNTWPDPQDILVGGYNKVVEKNEIEAGSSTACIITLDKTTGTVYSSNIGDSGFIVIRDGKVVYQTHELQHYFNAPYQLSVLPEEMKNDPINIMDSPNDAIIDQCTVEEGDVIVLGTDGLWDNIFNEEIITKLSSSIEKIDDIQKQIKQINEEFYHYQQVENTESLKSNEKAEKDINDISEEKKDLKDNENKEEIKENEMKDGEIKEDKTEKAVQENEIKDGEVKEDKIEEAVQENEIKDGEIKDGEVKEDKIEEAVQENEVKEIETKEDDKIEVKKDEEENKEIKENKENLEKEQNNDEITPNTSCKDFNEFIKKKEELNNECNKILQDIALKLTLDTKEMSRNFDKISPFSYNAKKCGIIHYGG